MAWRRGIACFISVLAVSSGCSSDPSAPPSSSALGDQAVTVGSFDFAESELLGEIYSQALEVGGYDVERAFRLGPRELVAPAIADGLVELVPEYAGTAVQFLSVGRGRPSADVTATHDALVEALEETPVVALSSAPAQNANAFVVPRAVADAHDLEDLSDVVPVASELTFAGPPECATRPLCLVGLEEVYGLRFGEVVSLDAGGPLTHQALSQGSIDMALLFTTDPAIAGDDLVELNDDRALQPAENVTPLVRTEVIDQFGPELTEILDAVSASLTTAALRDLNAEVAGAEDGVSTIAAAWLDAEGLG